ncbi:esterase-like activity of phytase family protein [Variovorax rhizosphaerae]|uniref:Esterase-like activity of phytase family protein n=1 Tax=Variovorax rhizosphaerae TaxID=1836200 RepID=A0ABU8WWV0_9BURK
MLTRRRLLGGAAALAGALAGCKADAIQATQAPAGTLAPRLRLRAEARLAHWQRFDGTTIGGLSGIDFDPVRGEYLLLSDDRSNLDPIRYYSASWAVDIASAPVIYRITTLLQADGSTWPNRRNARSGVPVSDPEALRLRPDTGTLLWASEGDEARGFGPALYESRRDGSLLRQFALPTMFEPGNDGRRGARDNLAFEGLALTPDHRTAWLAMEGPLIQDGAIPTLASPGGPCRFTALDVDSGRVLRQLAYLNDAVPVRPLVPGTHAENGVSEILMLDAHRMLVLERAWAAGTGNSLRLYEIDTRGATDVLAIEALAPGNHRPVAKTLVADFSTLGLSRLDNTEGMCWGPTLPNGHPLLVVISDDNFNPLQITQFAAFEFIDRP